MASTRGASAGGAAGGPPSAGSWLQDRALELLQLLARLRAQLVDERLARGGVGGERVRLPTGAVERKHELRAKALAERLLRDELLELGDHLGLPAEREVGVDPALERLEAQLAEMGRSGRGRLAGQVGERRAAPQRERFAQGLGGRRRLRARAPSTSRRKRSRSSSPGSVRIRYPGACVTSRSPSSRRSRSTWFWSDPAAEGGGSSPHTPSISCSAATTRFACRSSSAATARRFAPPSASTRSPSPISSGPRIRNSTSSTKSAGEAAVNTLRYRRRRWEHPSSSARPTWPSCCCTSRASWARPSSRRRVYDRFHELLADVIPHDGVIVSSFDTETEVFHCEYAWADGERLDASIFPPLPLNREGGGMQSRVIMSGESLLVNDVREQVKDEGTYYQVDAEGELKRIPEAGPPAAQAAMMVPIKLEGRVVGVVQLMSDRVTYAPEQLEVLEGIVTQTAIAVRHARLQMEQRRLAAAEAAARAVAAERAQAAAVLEAVGDGIFLVDDEGRVRFWNRGAELLLGLRAASVRDRPAAEAFPDWEAIADRVPAAGARSAAHPVTLPVSVGGRELWLSFVAVRATPGVVYAFRDVTGDRRLEEAKSDFITTISHELRTPMAAIYGAALTLLREDVEFDRGRQRELVEVIAQQATRLSQITEEVLLTSQLDRGAARVEPEPVDVAELARAAVRTMAPERSRSRSRLATPPRRPMPTASSRCSSTCSTTRSSTAGRARSPCASSRPTGPSACSSATPGRASRSPTRTASSRSSSAPTRS